MNFRLCCGYGNSGLDTRGYDCLVIPGALSEDGLGLFANEFCGASKGLASLGSFTADVTKVVTQARFDRSICCKHMCSIVYCTYFKCSQSDAL